MTIQPATDAAPDWATTPDLACPLCSYNLRGLTEPRCPECGFAFQWTELLDAKRDRHPWLFEHARQPRWARSFALTWARAGLPLRFWRDVVPSNPISIRRLLIYWFVANLPALSLTVAAIAIWVVPSARTNLAYRATMVPVPGRPGLYATKSDTHFQHPISSDELDQDAPTPWSARFVSGVWHVVAREQTGPLIVAAGTAVAWPWLSTAALLLFQSSIRRAKVNARHVLRVAIYGCDGGLLTLVVLGILFGPIGLIGPLVDRRTLYLLTSPFSNSPPPWWVTGGVFGESGPGGLFARNTLLGWWHVPMSVLIPTAVAIVVTVRLTIAYARYLRFPHPFATVLASQAIALLVAVVIIIRTFGGL